VLEEIVADGDILALMGAGDIGAVAADLEQQASADPPTAEASL
jgi:hypothetical protein